MKYITTIDDKEFEIEVVDENISASVTACLKLILNRSADSPSFP